MLICWCPITSEIINSIPDDSNVVLVVLSIRRQSYQIMNSYSFTKAVTHLLAKTLDISL